MPALTLDGLASAAQLPTETNDLIDAYGDELAQQAVQKSRTDSVPIADLLGLVVVSPEEEIAGVALASEVTAELLEDVPDRDRERLRVFLARAVPPTHLRLVVWDAAGIAMLRVDTASMQPAGQA